MFYLMNGAIAEPAIFMLCKIPVLSFVKAVYGSIGLGGGFNVLFVFIPGDFFCSYKHIFCKGLEKTSRHSWY